MRPVAVLLACLAAGVGLSARGTPAQSQSLNVLLITVDDLGANCFEALGQRFRTPNLDRLRAEGTSCHGFRAGGPYCAPSRASLLTGRYGIHNGVWSNSDDLPAEEVTLAEILQEHGYATGCFGKWHRGNAARQPLHPMDQGFEEFEGTLRVLESDSHYPKRVYQGRTQVPNSQYTPDRWTDAALDFITRRQSSPFFVWLSLNSPHGFVEAPAAALQEYAGVFPEEEPTRPVRATYAAMVTCIDANVGRVLDALEALGLTGRTLVLFVSDHGAYTTADTDSSRAAAYFAMNAPYRDGAGTLYDGSLRVPLLVRLPGNIPAGETTNAAMHSTDILPTVLEAIGLQPPDRLSLDGESVWPIISGRSAGRLRILFWESRTFDERAVLDGTGKLRLHRSYPRPENAELFDIEADPGEQTDLSAANPTRVSTLRQAADDWARTRILRAPTRLTAKRASSTSIRLDWVHDTGGERGFRIERSEDGQNFVRIAARGAGSLSYTSSGLTTGRTYFFRVCATDSYGASAPSPTASATP